LRCEINFCIDAFVLKFENAAINFVSVVFYALSVFGGNKPWEYVLRCSIRYNKARRCAAG